MPEQEKTAEARPAASSDRVATPDDIRGASHLRLILPGMRFAVTIRRPSTMILAAEGKLPASLASAVPHPRVYELSPEGVEQAAQAEEREETSRSPERVRANASFLLDQVCEAFIEPRCVREVKNQRTEICPQDLPAEAQEWMIDFVNGRVDVRDGRVVRTDGL